MCGDRSNVLRQIDNAARFVHAEVIGTVPKSYNKLFVHSNDFDAFPVVDFVVLRLALQRQMRTFGLVEQPQTTRTEEYFREGVETNNPVCRA